MNPRLIPGQQKTNPNSLVSNQSGSTAPTTPTRQQPASAPKQPSPPKQPNPQSPSSSSSSSTTPVTTPTTPSRQQLTSAPKPQSPSSPSSSSSTTTVTTTAVTGVQANQQPQQRQNEPHAQQPVTPATAATTATTGANGSYLLQETTLSKLLQIVDQFNLAGDGQQQNDATWQGQQKKAENFKTFLREKVAGYFLTLPVAAKIFLKNEFFPPSLALENGNTFYSRLGTYAKTAKDRRRLGVPSHRGEHEDLRLSVVGDILTDASQRTRMLANIFCMDSFRERIAAGLLVDNSSTAKSDTAEVDYLSKKHKLDEAFGHIMKMGGLLLYSKDELLVLAEDVKEFESDMTAAKESQDVLADRRLQAVTDEVLGVLNETKRCIAYALRVGAKIDDKGKEANSGADIEDRKMFDRGIPVIEIMFRRLCKDGVLTKDVWTYGLDAVVGAGGSAIGSQEATSTIGSLIGNLGADKVVERIETAFESRAAEVVSHEENAKKFEENEPRRQMVGAEIKICRGWMLAGLTTPEEKKAFEDRTKALYEKFSVFCRHSLGSVGVSSAIARRNSIGAELRNIDGKMAGADKQEINKLIEDGKKLRKEKDEIDEQIAFPGLFTRALYRRQLLSQIENAEKAHNRKMKGELEAELEILNEEIKAERFLPTTASEEINTCISRKDELEKKRTASQRVVGGALSSVAAGPALTSAENEELSRLGQKMSGFLVQTVGQSVTKPAGEIMSQHKQAKDTQKSILDDLLLRRKCLTNPYSMSDVHAYLKDYVKDDFGDLKEATYEKGKLSVDVDPEAEAKKEEESVKVHSNHCILISVNEEDFKKLALESLVYTTVIKVQYAAKEKGRAPRTKHYVYFPGMTAKAVEIKDVDRKAKDANTREKKEEAERQLLVDGAKKILKLLKFPSDQGLDKAMEATISDEAVRALESFVGLTGKTKARVLDLYSAECIKDVIGKWKPGKGKNIGGISEILNTTLSRFATAGGVAEVLIKFVPMLVRNHWKNEGGHVTEKTPAAIKRLGSLSAGFEIKSGKDKDGKDVTNDVFTLKAEHKDLDEVLEAIAAVIKRMDQTGDAGDLRGQLAEVLSSARGQYIRVLQNTIKDLEAAFNRTEILLKAVKSDCERMHPLFAGAKSALTRIDGKLLDNDKQIEIIATSLGEIDKSVKTISGAVAKQEAAVGDMEKETKELLEQKAALAKVREELKAQDARLKSIYELAMKTKESEEAAKKVLSDGYNLLLTQYGSMGKSIEAFNTAGQQFNTDYAQWFQESGKLSAEIRALSTKIAESQAKVVELDNSYLAVFGAFTRMEEINKLLKELPSGTDEEKAKIAALKKEFKELQAKFGDDIPAVDLKIKGYLKDIEAAKKALAVEQALLEDLKEEKSSMETKKDAMKSLNSQMQERITAIDKERKSVTEHLVKIEGYYLEYGTNGEKENINKIKLETQKNLALQNHDTSIKQLEASITEMNAQLSEVESKGKTALQLCATAMISAVDGQKKVEVAMQKVRDELKALVDSAADETKIDDLKKKIDELNGKITECKKLDGELAENIEATKKNMEDKVRDAGTTSADLATKLAEVTRSIASIAQKITEQRTLLSEKANKLLDSKTSEADGIKLNDEISKIRADIEALMKQLAVDEINLGQIKTQKEKIDALSQPEVLKRTQEVLGGYSAQREKINERIEEIGNLRVDISNQMKYLSEVFSKNKSNAEESLKRDGVYVNREALATLRQKLDTFASKVQQQVIVPGSVVSAVPAIPQIQGVPSDICKKINDAMDAANKSILAIREQAAQPVITKDGIKKRYTELYASVGIINQGISQLTQQAAETEKRVAARQTEVTGFIAQRKADFDMHTKLSQRFSELRGELANANVAIEQQRKEDTEAHGKLTKEYDVLRGNLSNVHDATARKPDEEKATKLIKQINERAKMIREGRPDQMQRIQEINVATADVIKRDNELTGKINGDYYPKQLKAITAANEADTKAAAANRTVAGDYSKQSLAMSVVLENLKQTFTVLRLMDIADNVEKEVFSDSRKKELTEINDSAAKLAKTVADIVAPPVAPTDKSVGNDGLKKLLDEAKLSSESSLRAVVSIETKLQQISTDIGKATDVFKQTTVQIKAGAIVTDAEAEKIKGATAAIKVNDAEIKQDVIGLWRIIDDMGKIVKDIEGYVDAAIAEINRPKAAAAAAEIPTDKMRKITAVNIAIANLRKHPGRMREQSAEKKAKALESALDVFREASGRGEEAAAWKVVEAQMDTHRDQSPLMQWFVGLFDFKTNTRKVYEKRYAELQLASSKEERGGSSREVSIAPWRQLADKIDGTVRVFMGSVSSNIEILSYPGVGLDPFSGLRARLDEMKKCKSEREFNNLLDILIIGELGGLQQKVKKAVGANEDVIKKWGETVSGVIIQLGKIRNLLLPAHTSTAAIGANIGAGGFNPVNDGRKVEGRRPSIEGGVHGQSAAQPPAPPVDAVMKMEMSSR